MPIKRLMSATQENSLEDDNQAKPTGDNVTSEEDNFERSLRPLNFSQVIGRQREKQTLNMMIKAALKDKSVLDHILFHGPPGLGKTSLAHVVATEMGAKLQVTSGPAIEKQGDLAAILTGLESNTVLFIDEIHRLRKTIEEILYPAMEDQVIDLIVGKGAGAKNVRLNLEKFTIIGATTRAGLISKPLRDRFGVDFRLDYYDLPEMTELVRQKAKFLNIEISDDAAELIASRSRSTPRISVKLLKRVRDNAIANNKDSIQVDLVKNTLELLNIDNLGLDYLDKKILISLIEKFNGGPVGVKSLAASVGEEVETVSDVYEPFLLQENLITRTARGRVATKKAYEHFGFTYD